MGAKDSKPTFISYEDAVKRVSDSELRRIREAFKRCAGANGTALSLEAFVHEVLCDGVPYEVAEWLYQACGGTKRGIAFRELLCGIVVLTKGNIEEKIKFLWTLYTNNQGENGTHIYKRDFARTLHMENTSLPVTGAQRSAEILLGLFGPGEKVTFDQFRSWLLIHKDATVVSKWLLSDVNVAQDLETPTFYQSLAGVTHLEERDIIELEKCFWSLRNAAPTGELDVESLTPLLSPPLPAAAVAGTFLAFDENRDGHVDFKELCCGLSAACRGPRTERLKFCFKIFDLDSDGVLNKKEVIDMVGVLCTVGNEHLRNQASRASTPDADPPEEGFDPESILLHLRDKLVPPPARKAVFQLGPSQDSDESVPLNGTSETEDEGIISSGTVLTLEDFLIWSVESAESLVSPFLQLLFDVCHVVLGLRPQCKHHERDIVLGWLRREVQRGYSVGQFWYLIAAEWWGAWLAYTGAAACCRHPRPQAVDEAIVCDESFTTNSTESMGSLLWRCETASLGSAGSSSGVSSAHAPHVPHPGPVDNARLRHHDPLQVRTLTGEGGHLRRDVPLVQHRDFELVPDTLWRALAAWYGAADPLPRQVIRPPNSDVELELYPLQLKLFRHVPSTQRSSSAGAMGGAVSMYSSVPLAPAPPERQLAYTAAFSRLATVRQVGDFLCAALGVAREDLRLWVLGAHAVLLDDERPTLEALGLDGTSRLLVERRNGDLTWPEEIGALGRATRRRDTLAAPDLPGATGLHNLGNTCFMNAALQAVWNTGPLTRYFNTGMHLYEVNPNNPLGTRGALALRYGELCAEVWSVRARSVAPLRVRWAVARWARALGGGGQHDAQELLAWLLDALHEDLNRAPPRADPPPPTGDSDGRADQTVAAEAWAAHTARNASIMTDLFYGQLKSRVRCDACGRESVRFDAYNMLSLPLPMESDVRTTARVILLDGSVPIKYGVRVSSEGTYLDFKKKLSELCGLPPESMVVVELSGATIARVLEDGARICTAPGELCVYEGAAGGGGGDGAGGGHGHENGWAGGAGGGAEVSVGGGNTSSLCMPALFCFKRSRSEVLMSQSPPSFLRSHSVYTDTADCRSNTLPKEVKREDPRGSPTPSVRSLPAESCVRRAERGATGGAHYIVGVHRKQCRADAYFLPSQRSKPALFGVPLLVPLRAGASGRDLYGGVWAQVARLLSARPPQGDPANHATDCDDSLGYEFPFTLRLVNGSGAWCGVCPWTALCRGCALPTDTAPLVHTTPDTWAACTDTGPGSPPAPAAAPLAPAPSPRARAKLERAALYKDGGSGGGVVTSLDLSVLGDLLRRRGVLLAIDWDPTALHLRYQSTREKACVEHWSVSAAAGAAGAAVDLASCLRSFTRPERLEQRYHCAACRCKQPATKTLQIWRAPPIMIIHLKRFQYVNNKWIKSQKVVNFPFENFDPTDFLASVPKETILRHRELMLRRAPGGTLGEGGESDGDEGGEGDEGGSDGDEGAERDEGPRDRVAARLDRRRRSSIDAKRRSRLQSTSLVTGPVRDDELADYHQHRLLPGEDPFNLQYSLYGVVSHSGQLSGGHYVAYARHPTGAWLCYNDSMCRELPRPPPIDPAAAYLLFYERTGLDYESYLPNIEGKEPVVKDSEALDPDESDLKKMCVIS